jgi:anti-sigma factor ChrR (cupin superfamily)
MHGRVSGKKDQDLAADLVLGTLAAEAHRAARIRTVEDRDFAARVAGWENRLAPLAMGEDVEPPADMLDRIESAIEAGGQDLPGTVTRRAGSGEWIDVSPGLRVKQLNRIESLNRQTIMVHLDAGAEYVAHEHSQDEEIYMISGDLIIGELTLGPGDFHVARTGRTHPIHRTRTGCVCIISQAIDW